MSLSDIFHHIPCPWRWDELGPRYFTGVVAILGDTITLVDAGTVDSPERAIVPFLRKIGRKAGEVSDIVLTHGHGDHFDGIPGLLEVSRPTIHVHELDKPKVEDLAQRTGFSPSMIESFTDKEVLELSGRRLRVIHTPGHSEGSICLLDEDLLIGVSGDSIQGRGKGRPLIFHSSSAYESSMNRLLDESVEVLMLGHPFPPYEKPVLKEGEPKTFVWESLEAIRELRTKVREVVEGLTEPFSIEDAMPSFPDLREATILCVLNELSEKGRLAVVKGDGGKKARWVRRA
jgi:glyoxylase-like metal-dependent hydrolase (beta-lactamase superfamily II)